MDNKELSESIKKTFYELSFGKDLGKADFSIISKTMSIDEAIKYYNEKLKYYKYDYENCLQTDDFISLRGVYATIEELKIFIEHLKTLKK